MNKFTAMFLSAALALPGIGTPMIASAQQQPGHSQQAPKPQASQSKASTPGKSTKSTPSKGYKSFKKGEKFDRNRARNYQVVNYRSFKKLPAPKSGYRYVRAGSDVLLIGTSSLKVYAVYSGMFR